MVKLSIPRRVVEQVVPRSMGSNCNGVACARPISWFSSSTHTHALIRSSDGHLRYDKFMTCQPTTSSSVRLCRSSASACCPCEWRRPRSGSSGRAKVPVVALKRCGGQKANRKRCSESVARGCLWGGGGCHHHQLQMLASPRCCGRQSSCILLRPVHMRGQQPQQQSHAAPSKSSRRRLRCWFETR